MEKRVGVIAYFGNFGPGLSYHKTTLAWHRELLRNGYRATLYVKGSCEVPIFLGKELNINPIFPKEGVKCRKYDPDMKRLPDFTRAVEALVPAFVDILKQNDVVIAHDIMLLREYVTLNAAFRKAVELYDKEHGNVRQPRILQVYHSNVDPGARPATMNNADQYPERYRWMQFPYSRYVSLSQASAQDIACSLHVPHSAVSALPNPAVIPDKILTRTLGTKWLEADMLQVYPFCASRWKHKGVPVLFRLLAVMKLQGIKPFLILAVANARGSNGQEHVRAMLDEAERRKLVDGEDFLVTAKRNPDWASGVPHDVLMQIMQYADLFIFPSQQEMCPNVLLEASTCGQLVAVPSGLQVAREMSPRSVLTFNFPVHGQPFEYPYGKKTFYATVARELWAEHRLNRVIQQKVHARRNLNIARLFKEYFEPLINSEIPKYWDNLEKINLNVPSPDEILAEEEREEQELMCALAEGGE